MASRQHRSPRRAADRRGSVEALEDHARLGHDVQFGCLDRLSPIEPNIGPTHEALRHSPAVPAAGQPVTITVTAADPDGVAGVTNWYSVNEGAWTALPMNHEGDGVYTVDLPGQSAADIVQTTFLTLLQAGG